MEDEAAMSRGFLDMPRDYVRVQAVMPLIGNEEDLYNEDLFRTKRISLAEALTPNSPYIGNPSSAILNFFPKSIPTKPLSGNNHNDPETLDTNCLFFRAKIETPSPGYKEKIKQRQSSNTIPLTWESIFEETSEIYLDPWYQLNRRVNYLRQEATLADMEQKEMEKGQQNTEDIQDAGVENVVPAEVRTPNNVDAEVISTADTEDLDNIDIKYDQTSHSPITHNKDVENDFTKIEHQNIFNHLYSAFKQLSIRAIRRLSSRKKSLIIIMLLLVITFQLFWFTSFRFMKLWPGGSRNTICITDEFGYNPLSASIGAFLGPENSTYRAPDTIDTFANYNFRNHSKCQISSLDLHSAFAPLCQTRSDFLQAYSGGGRIGFNAPFMPRGCDMRWFNTEEICEIFSRFEKVIVVGDSMMRHVVGALNVLLRKDLGYGAVTNWNFNDQELKDCFCTRQMNVKSCSVQGIFSTSSVLEHDPTSLACTSPFNLIIEMMLRFPLDPTEVDRYTALLSTTKPNNPYAFIFGHGLWNDLDLQATLNWLDGIQSHTLSRAPYLEQTLWPRLFITPNAAGIKKPDQWLVSQGDKALQIFEESMRIEAGLRGVEHLGTWNMSVQMDKYDGVHLDLKGNLVKAMGVLNWLNMIEVEKW